MTNEPVDLDRHRDSDARKAINSRRERLSHCLQRFQADQTNMQRRQEELENQFLAAPAETWSEAVAKAKYVLQLFAASAKAQTPRRRELIAQVQDDLTRLAGRAKDSP